MGTLSNVYTRSSNKIEEDGIQTYPFSEKYIWRKWEYSVWLVLHVLSMTCVTCTQCDLCYMYSVWLVLHVLSVTCVTCTQYDLCYMFSVTRSSNKIEEDGIQTYPFSEKYIWRKWEILLSSKFHICLKVTIIKMYCCLTHWKWPIFSKKVTFSLYCIPVYSVFGLESFTVYTKQ
jgi:hypothetical protein